MKDKETSIEALCDTLIDAVCERGEFDFVRDRAAPLPMAVIGDMLGVRREQREMFLRWSDDPGDVEDAVEAHPTLLIALSRATVPTDSQRRSPLPNRSYPVTACCACPGC